MIRTFFIPVVPTEIINLNHHSVAHILYALFEVQFGTVKANFPAFRTFNEHDYANIKFQDAVSEILLCIQDNNLYEAFWNPNPWNWHLVLLAQSFEFRNCVFFCLHVVCCLKEDETWHLCMFFVCLFFSS